MSISRFARWAVGVCALLWLIASRSFAQGGVAAPLPGQPAQDSPLPTPVFNLPPGPGESPIATPPAGQQGCTELLPCDSTAPQATPQGDFQTFLPGVTQPDTTQPAGPPPDLGAVLNYVAAGVVVAGGALKVYWFISDRRRTKTQ